ncbi:hypothetical protein PUN28_001217 [Cardiocondyla obscurior]|uniref:Uncharacterized protein n=1 Tax=Cardiocondyla obscurior TaxID=286306 RepID=A0AAW2H4E0_9HYME
MSIIMRGDRRRTDRRHKHGNPGPQPRRKKKKRIVTPAIVPDSSTTESDTENPAPQPWAPRLLQLPAQRLTRPPKEFLLPGDVRISRYTSPRWHKVPSPIVTPSPDTRTMQTDGKHRIQHAPTTNECGTQTDPWATTSSSDGEPLTYPENEIWGPIKVTLTIPHISYRERRME